MKKTLSLVLTALALAASMTSCGGDPELLNRKYNYDLSEYITLGEYKGLEAEGYRYEVTDEEVQQQIYATLSYYARTKDVTDRPAQSGDIVYIDYNGTIDGQPFEGGSEKDCEVTIGTGTFVQEFEESLIGKNPGETYEIDVTFPVPYPAYPEQAGKEAHFEIYVDSILEQELPLYTDDFARVYLKQNTTADFEKHVRTMLEDHYKDIYTRYIDSQIWGKLVDSTTVIKYPEEEVNAMYESIVTSNSAYAETLGITLDEYVQVNYELTEEEFYAAAKAECEGRVKEEMMCYAIARAEGITLSEEEYQTRALDYAINSYNVDSVAAFENLFDREVIRQTIMFDLVHELLVEYANVTVAE